VKSARTVTRLYPLPQGVIGLDGLYLEYALHHAEFRQRPLVYTNFVLSLDGRIAIEHPQTGRHGVPESVANPRDWRLFQELAAQADVLLTSARYLRELAADAAQDSLPLSDDPAYADLRAWRVAQGLPPQPALAVLSQTVDLPLTELCARLNRPVYVAIGGGADAGALHELERAGARVLLVTRASKVAGHQLVEALSEQGFGSIYSIAGPGVLETLLRDGVLDRLYLTHVHRLIGGESYSTLLEGDLLLPPADFTLTALYYDAGDSIGQMFGVYDAVQPVPRARGERPA
jgi:riboflavin biosynthesis pyrimidine reductase